MSSGSSNDLNICRIVDNHINVECFYYLFPEFEATPQSSNNNLLCTIRRAAARCCHIMSSSEGVAGLAGHETVKLFCILHFISE